MSWFWFSIIALHKLGAVVIPATHLLTKKDIVYRNNAASIKMIVCAGEEVILKHVSDALPESPTVETVVSVGPLVPEGYEDFTKGIAEAAPFVRPVPANANDDISLMYFTSGTTGNPKMVAHDFTYPLGHIATGSFWHNLHRDSLHLTIADLHVFNGLLNKLCRIHGFLGIFFCLFCHIVNRCRNLLNGACLFRRALCQRLTGTCNL